MRVLTFFLPASAGPDLANAPDLPPALPDASTEDLEAEGSNQEIETEMEE